jgi:hypothetical protein
MSFDLAVWYPDRNLSPEEAGERYGQLCDGDVRGVTEDPRVAAFYDELMRKHPEIDDVPEERIDDHEYCPWSVAMDRSPGHVIMCCVWSRAEYVRSFVGELASKHGLVLYDPQEGTVTFPTSGSPAAVKKPRWKLW